MFTFTRKRIDVFLASGVAALAAVGVVAGLSACSGGSSSPPNATQVLQSDGYTVSSAYTSALQSGIDGNSEVLSSIAGTNSSGDIQGVVVFDSASDEQAGASALQSQYSDDGLIVASNGTVLTVTGSESTWASIGN
jgi:hypothetical protein